MDPIRFAIDNPVKISVGVIMIILFGLLSLTVIPVQLTPNVDQPVISVTTRWEGASPQEIENDVIREQEDQLKSITGLEKMSAVCQQGEGQILLEFPVEMDKDVALREVSEKLRQVPEYPDNVDEPEVEASDPRNRDYIAWIILSSTDPNYDIRHLQKWTEDNVKTELERVQNVSEVNVLGGSEPEVQVRVDTRRLAQEGISPGALAQALQRRNVDISAGDVEEGKLSIRLRVTGQYDNLREIEQTVLTGPGEPVVRVRDVAEVVQTYKEPTAIVRSRGERSLAINAQREVGSNVMRVMAEFKQVIAYLQNDVLPAKAQDLGLDGKLQLRQVYDQTVYIDRAIRLVQSNLFVGGSLAVLVLLTFLRSFKFTLITALAIPISVIGTFVAMVAMGRNINVISLAGLAFAVGMVVDNAIVVLENIDRHQRRLHEGALHAAYTGAKEVWGAVLTATLTTLAVFIPVLLVEEEAGQLFRDISLAVCAAVTLSLLVSVMVIPVASSRLMQRDERKGTQARREHGWRKIFQSLFGLASLGSKVTDLIADTVGGLCRSWVARIGITVTLTAVALGGSYLLMPQASYLPAGNRNLVFGLLIPPPGYNLQRMEEIGLRMEDQVGPYWRAHDDPNRAADLPPIMMFDPVSQQMLRVDQPPTVRQFFFVGLESGLMFTGAISGDVNRVDPIGGLLNNGITQQPAIFGFAKKRSLFQTGGSDTGIELEFSGPDLDAVNAAAETVFVTLINDKRFGERAVQPDPGNFMIPGEEINVDIDMVRAGDVGLNNAELGTFVQMLGDGAIVDDYIFEGDSIDLTLVDHNVLRDNVAYLRDAPLYASAGRVVPLGAVADVKRTTSPQEIRRIERQRAVTLNIDVPEAMPLEEAERIVREEMIQPLRDSGQIAPSVKTFMAGSAAKLTEVKRALLGEWTGFNSESLMSLFTSRAFLALVVVFLVMAALFESWFYPLVIMFTVPLATVGGFLGLRIINIWTRFQPFTETQQLDMLSMLGFVILIGVVVNNAILIVHQALNFVRGTGEAGEGGAVQLEPQQAIRESVRSRVRPIFMSTLTSVGGMLPLVIFSGAGSELYRGLGSVVVGGLILSSLFTLLLTPIILSMVFALFPPQRQSMETAA